jgi:Tfp pilus assembly protein PilX
MFSGSMKGQSTLMVMIITLAMFLIGSAALAMGLNAKKIAAFEMDQDQAYYIAEAGVEKVLADARKGPAWLVNLNVGSSYDYLAGNLNGGNTYGEGTIESINVKKSAENNGQTILEIESQGRCKGSVKKVGATASLETLYAEDLFRGLWVGNCSAPGGYVFNLTADACFSGGEVFVNSGSVITGDIYSRDKVYLQCEAGGATAVRGDIYTLGGVGFTGTCLPSITGRIFVDDISKVPEEVKNITVVMTAGEMESIIPEISGFPALLSESRLEWYRENADYKTMPLADNNMMVFQNGIYYLKGDQELSGTYSGNALVVIEGSAVLGTLTRNSVGDSLAILAGGQISCDAACTKVEALVYAKDQVVLNNGAPVKGSVLSAVLTGQGSQINIAQDDDLLNDFREISNWTTCFIKINKWSE